MDTQVGVDTMLELLQKVGLNYTEAQKANLNNSWKRTITNVDEWDFQERGIVGNYEPK